MGKFILANCTDTGKIRSVNEDSMTTFDCPNGRVVVVCDGMGGQNAGDVASQLAVSVIQDILTDNTFPTPEAAITRSMIAANQALLRKASQDESLSGMGATCVMVIIKDGKVFYGSVGDSRIYYISNGEIQQITKDQSYVQTLVDEGRITQEAAEHHKDKNQITNAMGIESMTPPVVCQTPIIPAPGSVFLLCSDGLSGMISNNAILKTVANSNVPLIDRAQQLVDLANAAGGMDNITVQLIEFPSAGPAMSPRPMSTTRAAGVVDAKTKRRRNKTVIAATCLIMTAVVGGGAYWYKTNQKTESQQSIVITPKQKKKENPPKKESVEVKETIIVREEVPEKGSRKSINDNKTADKKNLSPRKSINPKEVVGINDKPSKEEKTKDEITNDQMRKVSEKTIKEKVDD